MRIYFDQSLAESCVNINKVPQRCPAILPQIVQCSTLLQNIYSSTLMSVPHNFQAYQCLISAMIEKGHTFEVTHEKIVCKFFLVIFQNTTYSQTGFFHPFVLMGDGLIFVLLLLIIRHTLLYEMPSNSKGKNFVSKIRCYCPQNTMEIICRR